MKEVEFKSKMLSAVYMEKHDDRPHYWKGYIQGLWWRFAGESHFTKEQHDEFMKLICEHDSIQTQMGRGYRDGLSEVAVHQVVCLRCRYDWMPRWADNPPPTICPKCKSRYWDVPPKEEKGKKEPKERWGSGEDLSKVAVHLLSCSRCQYVWLPKSAGRPITCPKCKNPYWDKPITRVLPKREGRGRPKKEGENA
ncbi:MAG: hypothetical protein WCO89_07420 [Syntrophus sp. (in: bacteria)]